LSLQDKIVKILKKHGALSSEEIKAILEKENEIDKSVKTVQRKLSTLIKNGIVKAIPLGRELKYSLDKEAPSAISDFFLNKFWSELFRIRQELVYHENPGEAFVKLRSLLRMLPEGIKKKIVADIEKANLQLNPYRLDYGFDRYDKILEFKDVVEELIDRISTLLHKELRIGEDVGP
jgi:arginine repressor